MKSTQKALGALAVGTLLAMGMTGCAWLSGETQHRSPQQTTSDGVINGMVKTALAADDLVKARRIDVDTVRGVVTLNGTVGSPAEKAQAIKLARSVSGVVEVKDNLRMGG
jgi:hyperosmotically inducible protein